MKFKVEEIINREICHFASNDLVITSIYNKIYVDNKDGEYKVNLPQEGWKRFFGLFRLSRRAMRLDKCNVAPVENGLVIIRQGKVYHYNEETKFLKKVLNLTNCRNVLHQSIAVIDGKEIFFGEYGNNPQRKSVPVYRSRDGGKTWDIVFVFPEGKIKHVHGCYYDPYEKKIWTLTGDFEGECHILCSDKGFKSIEWIGDGSQIYRTCNLFFEKNEVHWLMDSQLQDCYHVEMDRQTRNITKKQVVNGPVWYIKRLDDGYYVCATAQEIGPGVKDKYAHLMVTKDLEKWETLYRFKHDGLPKRYFKFGVIGFADGLQTSRSFYIFAEALAGYDGKVIHCSID